VFGLNELEVNSGFILLYPHEGPIEGRGCLWPLQNDAKTVFRKKRGDSALRSGCIEIVVLNVKANQATPQVSLLLGLT
jgi:hypothetical protein